MIALPNFHQLDLHRWSERVAAMLHLVLRFGSQAASVFVFLSGYFIVPRLVTIACGEQAASPLLFLRNRFARIYPTLLAAIALTFLCDVSGIFGLSAADLYRAKAIYDPVTALAPTIGLGNLLSLQPTFVSAFGSNGPLWTLGYIVQFYVVGISLACGWARRPAVTGLAGAILLAAATVWRPEWLLLFLTWSLACAARLVVPQRPVAIWLLLPAAAMFVVANCLPGLATIIPSAIAAGLFVIAIAAPDRRPDRPASRIITWLSGLSYAVYAVHFPLAMLVYVVLARAVGMGPQLWLMYFAGSTAVVLAVAWLIDRGVGTLAKRRTRP